MKKILIGLLACAMLGALSSCAETDPVDTLDYTTPPVVTTGPESPPDTTAHGY